MPDFIAHHLTIVDRQTGYDPTAQLEVRCVCVCGCEFKAVAIGDNAAELSRLLNEGTPQELADKLCPVRRVELLEETVKELAARVSRIDNRTLQFMTVGGSSGYA